MALQEMSARVAVPIFCLSVVALGCAPPAPRVVDIVATEYALSAPASLPPGRVILRFINAGTVPHEAQLFRFRRGITPDSGRALLHLSNFPDSLADADGAVLIAAPRDTTPEQVALELHPGELYALVCQFRDGPGKPKHDALGMYAVMQVEPPRPQ